MQGPQYDHVMMEMRHMLERSERREEQLMKLLEESNALRRQELARNAPQAGGGQVDMTDVNR